MGLHTCLDDVMNQTPGAIQLNAFETGGGIGPSRVSSDGSATHECEGSACLN
jgi:hypothetical protein